MEREAKLGKPSRPTLGPFGRIIARCEASGIGYEWHAGLEGERALSINIEEGRGKRRVTLFGVEDAQRLLDFDFEKYVFIEGYRHAICCYEKGYVEAEVRFISPVAVSNTMLLGWITGRGYRKVASEMASGKDVRLELVGGRARQVRVSIGGPSEMLLAMVNFLVPEEALSIRLEGLEINSNVEAREQLGRVTNSLFFELKRKRDVALFVPRHYEVGEAIWEAKRWLGSKQAVALGFPRFEYDKQGMEMFWHAESAYNMPLLKYLAYYQILESYFMKYSVLEARKEIRNCLKDPAFNVDDDDDIVKIVTCVSGKLGTQVREKDMLGDTIRGCISKEELVEEMSVEGLKEYFKNEYKVVSQYKISQENKDVDMREQLAERIYDIRCRIVHTKEDDRRGRIMPFTREAALLQEFDLPMIEDIVNKVLIANSRPLSF